MSPKLMMRTLTFYHQSAFHLLLVGLSTNWVRACGGGGGWCVYKIKKNEITFLNTQSLLPPNTISIFGDIPIVARKINWVLAIIPCVEL